MQSSPLDLILELVRTDQAGDPYAFRFAPQEYLLRGPGGGFETARFEWEQALLADLVEVRRPGCDPAVVSRLGETLRRFLAPAGWSEWEAQILEAVRARRPILVTLRFAAAELFSLPWELLTLKSSGQHLGELPGVILRYEWPETTSASSRVAQMEGGRVLFAWSAAGGVVPASKQLAAIEGACQRGFHPFDRERDVLANVSCGRLVAALDAADKEGRPIAVLHLLCHGSVVGSTYGLALNDEGDGVVVVDAGRLRQLLAPHAERVRLVVLSACDSGNSGALGNHLGSSAQTLHRAGFAAVVASRFPLSVSGSIKLTAALYDQLLVQLSALEGALDAARAQLLQSATSLDWASVQLYARAADGHDTRPITFRPFRGLLAFQPQHHRFFFGRESLIEEICRDLAKLTRTREPRFLIVAGASGTGKSSAVLAGALPRLCAENPALRHVTLRPGSAPAQSLAQALAGLAAAPASAESPVLLVVDQLEELFTHSEDTTQRQAFVRRLWQLGCAPDSHISIIATLRVDFIGRCGELSLDESGKRLDSVAYDEAHRVFVAQMGAASLRKAIEEPARLCGLMLAEGLAQRMIADVGGEPGALPLLEDTLDLLWQQRSGRTLIQAAYDEVGGVAGALHGRADALAKGLSAEEQRAARRLLVRLVNVGDDIALSTRRRVQIAALRPRDTQEGAIFDRVLARLIDARLLVRDGEGATQLIEVAHEALIRKWPLLGEWVKADRTMLVARERIEGWVREHNDPTMGTLLVGSQIGFVEQFVKDYPDDCPADAHKLLKESVARSRQRQRVRKWILRGFVLASLILAGVGALGLYQSRLVAAAASASRDMVRMNAVRALVAENQPADSLAILREVEAEDLERVPGFWRAAVELLRDVAEEESTWKLPASADVPQLYGISSDCTHVAVISPTLARAQLYERERLVETIDLGEDLKKQRMPKLAAALSGDAKSLVLFEEGQPARLWRFDKKDAAASFPVSSLPILDAGFSPDGARILGLDSAGFLHGWNSDGTGGHSLLLPSERAPREALALSAEPFLLATRSRGSPRVQITDHTAWYANASSVELYSADRHQRLLFAKEQLVQAVSLCANKKQIATVSRTGRVMLWGLGSPPLSLGMFTLPPIHIKRGRFTRDGAKFVVVLADGTVQVWNSDGTGRPLLLAEPVPVQTVQVSPDSQRLVLLRADDSVRIRRLDGTGVPVDLPFKYSALYPNAWSGDGRRILALDRDKTARVLSAASGEPVLSRSDVSGSPNAAAFSPDGSRLAWLTQEGQLQLHSLDEPNRAPRVKQISLRHHDLYRAELVFSADGKQVVIWDAETAVRSFSAEDLSETILFAPESPIYVTLSPLATHYAMLTRKKRFTVGALPGGAPLLGWEEPDTLFIGRLTFSGNGARFLRPQDTDAIFGRTDGRGGLTALPLDVRGTSLGELSHDGKQAALIGLEGLTTVWDLDLVSRLRPAALRKRMWELPLDCSASYRVEPFLSRSIAAQSWDPENCKAMRSCISAASTAAPLPDGSHADYDACLKTFRERQRSWRREFSSFQRVTASW